MNILFFLICFLSFIAVILSISVYTFELINND